MSEFVLVLSTAPDEPRADELARTLVEERLAACVNVLGPMHSTYRWKGAVERAAERQLVIKTSRARLAPLERRLRALHPYAIPEFLVLSVDGGSAAYLAWIRESCVNGSEGSEGS